MADTVVTVIAGGGGDYTTVQAAVAAADVSSGKYIIRISDNSLYDESIDIDGVTGTPSATNYLVLEAASANSHVGVPGTGHARLTMTNGFVQYGMEISESYTVVQNLEIISDVADTDTHTRMWSVDNVLFSRCIFRQLDSGSSANIAIRMPSLSSNNYFDNCLFLGHVKIFDISWLNTSNRHCQIYLDHCAYDPLNTGTIYLVHVNMTDTNSGDGTVLLNNDVTVHAYNCWGFELDLRQSSSAETSGETYTLNGDQNVQENLVSTGTYSYDVIQSSANDVEATGGITSTTTTANAIIITNQPALTSQIDYDATPVKATGAGSNLILKNGVNRIGSEPDSRQDFSTDIAGATRPTSNIDIGPFQFSRAGFKYYNGTDWVDSVSVKYYNGTDWADVVGVKYYNGTTWADPV